MDNNSIYETYYQKYAGIVRGDDAIEKLDFMDRSFYLWYTKRQERGQCFEKHETERYEGIRDAIKEIL